MFNIRVYGIWIDGDHQVLVSDEYYKNKYFTKFPGGGLKYGEGIIDCLKREWLEELKTEIEISQHFYTTDFFQKSAFDNSQVISIYYKVKPISKEVIHHISVVLNKHPEGIRSFKKIAMRKLSTDCVTFPTDKIVVRKLLDEK